MVVKPIYHSVVIASTQLIQPSQRDLTYKMSREETVSLHSSFWTRKRRENVYLVLERRGPGDGRIGVL